MHNQLTRPLLTVLFPCLVLIQACLTTEPPAGDDAEDVGVVSEAAASAFGVMTVNVRIPVDGGENTWSQRLPRLVSMIKADAPAIIGLQELRASTHADLSAALPSYWWYWVERGDGEMIAIYVDTARFDVLAWNYRDVTNGQRNNLCDGGEEDPKNRPIQVVKLRDRQNGRIRYFYNTHYPSKNSCERRGMADIVADYIDGRADQSADVILVGDLNDGIEPDGRLNGSYSRLLSNTGFRSAYAAVNAVDASGAFRTGNGDWNKTARTGRMIDHILVSTPGAEVLSAFVDRSMFTSAGSRVWCSTVTNGYCSNGTAANSLRLYSDHWAVVAWLAP